MDDDYAMLVILIVGLTILGGVLLWITIVSGAVTRLPTLCSQRGSGMSDDLSRAIGTVELVEKWLVREMIEDSQATPEIKTFLQEFAKRRNLDLTGN